MSLKSWNRADSCVKVATSLFLACKASIDPLLRLTIPSAMRAKGYSKEEAVNWTLQQQVRQEVAPLSSAVAIFFSPPPPPPYLIPCCHPFGLQPLSLPLVYHHLSSAAVITTSPPLPCVTHLLANATKPLPLICCQSCHRITSCLQPSSLLVCCHCTLLWLIVKLLCAGHCCQTIPFCLPPKLSSCCLLSATIVSLLAPPAVPSFDPLPPSLLIALQL
jgi:hypothetical protein